MNDLKLDSTGDLEIVNGDLSLLNKEEEVARQTLEINFKFFEGEWFLDTEYGIPYLQTIVRKGTPKEVVDTILYDVALNSYNISKIISFTSSIDRESRVYTLDELLAETLSGEIVSITNISI